MTIRDALTLDDVALVRTLFQEYERSLNFSLCFQDFASELAGLPGEYGPPRGALLLAEVDGAAAGCVALRPLTDGACEMKRLFVRPGFRGLRVGRLLCEALLERAREAGYASMKLDTRPQFAAAVRLYQELGFAETGPYGRNPFDDAMYLERRV